MAAQSKEKRLNVTFVIREGRAAAKRGRSEEECPYSSTDFMEYNAWLAGHRDYIQYGDTAPKH